MKSPRLNCVLKVYKNDKVVQSVRRSRKIAFARFIEAKLPEQTQKNTYFYLKVDYNPSSQNIGTYSSKKDLIFAYQVFTEDSLVRSLNGL